MKVLILCLSISRGGLELYVKQCFEQLPAQNLQCTLMASAHGYLGGIFAQHPHLVCIKKPVLSALPMVRAWQVARYIDKHEIDIIHIHCAKDFALAAFAKTLSLRKPKLVYSRHMARGARMKRDIYHRFLYAQVDLLLAVTQELVAQVKKTMSISSDRVQCLYLGVAPAPLDVVPRQEILKAWQCDPHVFTVGLFGRITEGKGQDLAIAMVKQLRDQGKKIQLVIIGHAMTQAYLEQLKAQVSAQDLAAQIKFVPFVKAPMRFMHAFDVIILPSHHETFGLVLPEAMRCKVMVIGANTGGVLEIIDDQQTGLLFESKNAQDLADKIDFVMCHPEKKAVLAQRGYKKAEHVFAEEVHFKKLKAIYAELSHASE